MTRKTKQMAELRGLTNLALRAVQLELAQLGSKERALRQNLTDLTTQRSDRAQAIHDSGDPAFTAGADLRWHQWVDQRRAVINIELVRVMAQIDQCQGRLRRTFGRDQAVQSLADRVERAEIVEKGRAALYES